MRKCNIRHNWMRAMAGGIILLAVLMMVLSSDAFSIVSLADSTGKITATSAKIRKEPSTSSEELGGVLKDAVISVKGQTTASDGYIWYQVSDSGITGYIRSDLMTITDGTTPGNIVTPTGSQTSTTATPTTSTPDEPLVQVTEVEPVSASISGGSQVRVRQNASTTSRIVKTVQSGSALTVIGTATGTDGNEWRYVSFVSGGSEVSGFVRADFISVDGEIVPAGTAADNPDNEQPDTADPEPQQTIKDWDTYYGDDNSWHLKNNTTGDTYNIDNIFKTVNDNKDILETTIAKNKTQQIIVIILVILLIAMATLISILFFKLKDVTDAAYFDEVEKDTVRRRSADRPIERTQSGQRGMQNMGGEGGRRPVNAQPNRPGGSGQRPMGGQPNRAGGNGQRPMGGQPNRAGGNGQRPSGGQPNREGGQRPSGGQRPMGGQPNREGGNGQRPMGGQPNREGGNGPRPSGAQPNRMADNSQQPVNRNIERDGQDYDQEYDRDYTRQNQRKENVSEQSQSGWKSKNFANEDEFEFQFLDWDDDKR